MRLDTASGLHGELIAYLWQSDFAVVRRDDAPFPSRQYSTHTVWEEDGVTYATGGNYDLTIDEAMSDFARRAANWIPKAV